LHVSPAKEKCGVSLDAGSAKMRIVAIVQARMGSTRLPGKVLMDLNGETVLGRVIKRLSRATLLDRVVVATSDKAGNEAIAGECLRLGVDCFQGSEADVLDRYYQTARVHEASVVVRVTADCPLIDAGLVDETIRTFQEQGSDYTSNVIPRTYPRGLDTEVFTFSALERAWQLASEAHQREHVTPYLYEHPEKFRLGSLSGRTDYSRYRWTVDTREDLELLRTIYSRFDNRDDFHWQDIILLMEREPDLAELNSQVLQKSVREL
jgi:spore coat polysaccharide biosynthesis protein SpsF